MSRDAYMTATSAATDVRISDSRSWVINTTAAPASAERRSRGKTHQGANDVAVTPEDEYSAEQDTCTDGVRSCDSFGLNRSPMREPVRHTSAVSRRRWRRVTGHETREHQKQSRYRDATSLC